LKRTKEKEKEEKYFSFLFYYYFILPVIDTKSRSSPIRRRVVGLFGTDFLLALLSMLKSFVEDNFLKIFLHIGTIR
jgi:hypothetical protein